MASGFDSGRASCEGEGCRATTDVTYCVEEKRQLCEECAAKTGWVRKEGKGGLKLFCDKHNEAIRIHCKTHDESICIVCATIKHVQPSCERQDLDDSIAEKKQQLIDLQATARDKRTMWGNHGEKISRCKDDAFEHLKKVKDQIDSLVDDEIEKVKDRAQRQEALINQEADDAIRRINEKREKRLKECNNDADKQLKPVEDKRCALHDEVTMILDVTIKKVNELQGEARDVMKAMNTTAQRIEGLLQDNKELINGAQNAIASLTDTLEKTVEEGVVEHITRTVRGVRFIEGVEDEKYNGRIGGFDDKWELYERIGIPEEVKVPLIVGHIGNTDVMMADVQSRVFIFGYTFKINIINKTTEKVITNKSCSYVSSCALLNEDTVLCGMNTLICSKDNWDDAILLYDKEWNLIKRISVSLNSRYFKPNMDICVDKDGMIIAAVGWQNKIHVINPDDGRTVKTIVCRSSIRLCGTLSSGDFVAIHYPISDKILIINRDGAEIEIPIVGNVYHCAVDPLTEDLYPVYKENDQNLFCVNHLSRMGEDRAKRILQYTPSQMKNRFSPVVITPAGKIVVCDGRNLLVYQKQFGF